MHTYELTPNSAAAVASRILVGSPARQPDLVRASRKTDGGAAEGSRARGFGAVRRRYIRSDYRAACDVSWGLSVSVQLIAWKLSSGGAQMCALTSVLAIKAFLVCIKDQPNILLYERYGVTVALFAAWRVDTRHICQIGMSDT